MTNVKLTALNVALWIVVIAVGTPHSAAQESLSYLPVFPSEATEFLGLSLVNASGVSSYVTVTWTNSDGNRTQTGRLSLAPRSQRVLLVKEILVIAEDPTEGWIEIGSQQPGLVGYLTSGKEGVLDGTELASNLSTTILLAHIAVNTGFAELEHTDTLVTLVNPSSATASARVQLAGLGGAAVGNLAVSIPPRASRTVRISEAFRDVLPPNGLGGLRFQGYVEVASDVGLAGWLRIDTPLSRALLRGRAAEEIRPAALGMVSHFADGSSALYVSELNLINVGDAEVTLELLAQDERGKVIGRTLRRSLGPGQGIREYVPALFGMVVPAVFPPPMISGYIRIRSADGKAFRIAGNISISSGIHAASMLFAINTSPAPDWIVPFAISGPDYFTGYSIANANELLTVQADVTIELLDSEGRLAGPPRSISLSPSARTVGLIEENIRSGYLRMHANGPVVPLVSIGTRSSMLAPVPVAP